MNTRNTIYKSLIFFAAIILSSVSFASGDVETQPEIISVPVVETETVSDLPDITTTTSSPLAQVYGGICRFGYYWCWLYQPLPIGVPCWCPGFQGLVSQW